jgi:hypothetical protein
LGRLALGTQPGEQVVDVVGRDVVVVDFVVLAPLVVLRAGDGVGVLVEADLVTFGLRLEIFFGL